MAFPSPVPFDLTPVSLQMEVFNYGLNLTEDHDNEIGVSERDRCSEWFRQLVSHGMIALPCSVKYIEFSDAFRLRFPGDS